jgi:tetratricopeptide (TPR) repeat protein
MIGIAIFSIVIVGSIISSIVKVAITYSIGKSLEKPTIGSCLTQGFKHFIPVATVGFVVTLAVIGSSFLLIIPAIVISVLFMFYSYEIILGGKTWFKSLGGSMQIVSQHFGGIILRYFIFWAGVYGLYYLPIYIIELIVKSINDNGSGAATIVLFIIAILKFFANILLAYYSMVLSYTVYLHAKNSTDATKESKTTWIWIVSLIGWILALVIGFQVSRIMQTPAIQDKIKTVLENAKSSSVVEQSEQEKLDTWRNKMSPEVSGLYNQSKELFNQLKNAGADLKVIKKLSDENISILKKAIALDDKNPELWIALASAYTWDNSVKGLDQSISASKKAEELDPSILTYAKNTGEMLVNNENYDEAILKLQQVIRKDDNYGMAHILLGIAYKNTGLKDSARVELERGIEILNQFNENGDFDLTILNAKKSLETLDQPVVKKTSTNTQSQTVSCTSYPIREGEFASNKCYIKKDLDDLLYYLTQFNGAVATYNGAVSSMSITCNGSDFFKQQCEEDKATQSSAQSKIDSYKATIKSIIAKGK